MRHFSTTYPYSHLSHVYNEEGIPVHKEDYIKSKGKDALVDNADKKKVPVKYTSTHYQGE